MNPETAAKTATPGTEYRHAAALSSLHVGRPIRVEGDKGIYQLEAVAMRGSYVEVRVTRAGRPLVLGLPPTKIVEVQP